jgi:hypothetical protein
MSNGGRRLDDEANAGRTVGASLGLRLGADDFVRARGAEGAGTRGVFGADSGTGSVGAGMRDVLPLAERLSPDRVARLATAGLHRFASAEVLRTRGRRLAAVYFDGYSAEMWLSAAYFRSAGFKPYEPIDRDTRHRRMVQARTVRMASGDFLMNSDPHPLVGWARFLEWQRSASGVLTNTDARRLKEAVNKAIEVYKYWRPDTRTR